MIGKFFKQKKAIKKSEPKKKQVSHIVLVVDIRSSSVGAAIVKKTKDTTDILFNLREYFFMEQKVTPEDFVTRTEIALKKVLDNLIHKNPLAAPVEKAEIFYSSPWYKTYIKSFNRKEKKATVLSKEYFTKVIKEDLDTLSRKEEIMEKKITSVMINGYQINDPFDKKVKEMDANFYISIVNKKTRKGFEKILKDFAPRVDINHNSHPLTFFTVLRNRLHSPQDYVLMDITGELSEVAIIKGGHFSRIFSFPYGTHDFVRKIMEHVGYDYATAFSAMKMICSGEAKENCDPKLADFFYDLKRDWLQNVKKLMDESKVETLPQTVYVTADQDIKEIMEFILNDVETYASVLKIGRKPNVHFLGSKAIENLAQYKNPEAKKDAQISIEASFVEFNDTRH